MPTTSTVPALKAALKTALSTALSPVQVAYAWPGPTTAAEGVYLGLEADATSEISSIKPGRQRRQEVFRLQVVCQTFRATNADTALNGPDDAEARAFVLAGKVEDVLADDASPAALGASGWWQLVGFTSLLEPFEHGWSARVVLTVQSTARLT